MSKKRCLYCYDIIQDSDSDFHKRCCLKFFGSVNPPALEYTIDQMLELGEKVIKAQRTVTGVHPKLSLGIQNIAQKNTPKKLTIVGVWSHYILKPPSTYYENLPELEDLTMHLAQITGIQTVPHTLIRLKSGELSYLTKRIERKGKAKLHMEDMCQLTGKLTEAKYRGSYEQIGKAIISYSEYPGLDIINFFEQVLFSFVTGNNNMHLKNFSLLKDPDLGYKLSPAYDMLASGLIVEGDDEELALTLNGKRKNLKKSDFELAFQKFNIDSKVLENIFRRFKESIPKWHDFVDISFLPENLKVNYHIMIENKAKQIEI